jgi:hypothetical protein
MTCVIASSLPEISQRAGYNGGFSAPILGSFSLQLGKSGNAAIVYTGTGFMFSYQGDPTTGSAELANFAWLGGNVSGTASAAGAFKLRDAFLSCIMPRAIREFTAGYGVLYQNWYDFTEQFTLSGYGSSTVELRRNLVSVEFQGKEAATAYEGESAPTTWESFKGFTGYNWFVANGESADWRVMKVNGRLYESHVVNVSGNAGYGRGAGESTTLVEFFKVGSTEGADFGSFSNWGFEGSLASDIATASNASPAVLGVTGHGLTTGDKVTLFGLSGGQWAVHDEETYEVTVIDADSFSVPIDGTGLGVYSANSGEITRGVMFDFSGSSGFTLSDIPRITNCQWTAGASTNFTARTFGLPSNDAPASNLSAGQTSTPWRFDSAFRLTGSIITNITADVTDFNPPNLGNIVVLDLQGDGDYTINSIGNEFGTSWTKGRILFLVNRSVHTFTIANDGPGVLTNRFVLQQDLPLVPFSNAIFQWYGGRWRLLSLYNADLYGTPGAYTVTDYVARRTVAADAASLTVSGTYTQSEIEAIRDELDELQEAYCTLVADLKAKLVLS